MDASHLLLQSGEGQGRSSAATMKETRAPVVRGEVGKWVRV